MSDAINPDHYRSHPSGVECIQITEHMGFNLGNAVKYIWRADLKGNAIQDLEKARWYVDREIAKRSRLEASEGQQKADPWIYAKWINVPANTVVIDNWGGTAWKYDGNDTYQNVAPKDAEFYNWQKSGGYPVGPFREA